MRPSKAYFIPDMWNDWHWFVYDALKRRVAQSARGHFHLCDARNEAEAVIRGLLA
jgi:hypothetical protein